MLRKKNEEKKEKGLGKKQTCFMDYQAHLYDYTFRPPPFVFQTPFNFWLVCWVH